MGEHGAKHKKKDRKNLTSQELLNEFSGAGTGIPKRRSEHSKSKGNASYWPEA